MTLSQVRFTLAVETSPGSINVLKIWERFKSDAYFSLWRHLWSFKKATSVTAESDPLLSDISVRAVRHSVVWGFNMYFNIEIWLHLKIIPYCVCVLCVVFNWRHELAFLFSLDWNGWILHSSVCVSGSVCLPPVWSISQQRRHCSLYRLNHTVHHRGLRSAELWVRHAVSVRAGVGGLLEGSGKELLYHPRPEAFSIG